MNPGSECDLENILTIFKEKPKNVEWKSEGNDLNFKYYIDGIPFRFCWSVKEGDSKDFSQIAVSLLKALKESQVKQEKLIELVEKKDKEIDDYRRQDVNLFNSE